MKAWWAEETNIFNYSKILTASVIYAFCTHLISISVSVTFKHELQVHQNYRKQLNVISLTPCSSSLRSVSLTLGEVEASLRQCRLRSGKINSSSLLGERPRGVVWRAAEGTDSSRIEPLRVFSCRKMTGTRAINESKTWCRLKGVISYIFN